MRQIILTTLEGIATNRQVNFSSQSARIMIADKLEVAISKHIREEISDTIEEIVCGADKGDCCEGDCDGN
jgi:hypothetical protein